MMRRAKCHKVGAAGFTLVEMLVALALIGLMASLSTQLLRPPSANLRVEAATRALCATLRATRSRAIATNSETSVAIDLARMTFNSPVAAEQPLPRDAIIEIDVASSQRWSVQTAGVLFFPDGSSTGGNVVIRLSDRHASIEVNWLTGETTCSVA
jgi:general secretion pathway protein H